MQPWCSLKWILQQFNSGPFYEKVYYCLQIKLHRCSLQVHIDHKLHQDHCFFYSILVYLLESQCGIYYIHTFPLSANMALTNTMYTDSFLENDGLMPVYKPTFVNFYLDDWFGVLHTTRKHDRMDILTSYWMKARLRIDRILTVVFFFSTHRSLTCLLLLMCNFGSNMAKGRTCRHRNILFVFRLCQEVRKDEKHSHRET